MSSSLGFWSVPFMFLTELGSWWGDKDVWLLNWEAHGECPAGQGASTARLWEELRPGCQGGGKRKMWMLFGNVGQGQEPKSKAKRASLALLPTLFSLWPSKRETLPVFSFSLGHLGPPTLLTPRQICSSGFSELRFIQLPLTRGQDALL